MVPVLSLWLPILLSAVAVFIASSLIHVVVGWHANDFAGLPGEDEVMETFRRLDVPPGSYGMPHPGSPSAMREPAYQEKLRRGPIVFMTVVRGREPSMAKSLVLWFLYSVIVGIAAAYIAGRALPPGAAYGEAFRFAGATAFFCYALADWHQSIWWNRKWSITAKNTLDGLIYGLVTGGIFGWLWP